MRAFRTIGSVLVAGVLSTAGMTRAEDLGTAFTYQGRLEQNGVPVNTSCNLEFKLWDDPETGIVLGTDLALMEPIDEGFFTVKLDFGAGVFDGEARWLEIIVQCPGDDTPTPLTPRQELTPAPYSVYAPSAGSTPWTGLTGVPPGFRG